MKQHKIRRIILSMYAVTFSVTMLTGFTSYAAENNISDIIPAVSLAEDEQWEMSDTAGQMCEEMVAATKSAAGEARQAYIAKVEEEKRKGEVQPAWRDLQEYGAERDREKAEME